MSSIALKKHEANQYESWELVAEYERSQTCKYHQHRHTDRKDPIFFELHITFHSDHNSQLAHTHTHTYCFGWFQQGNKTQPFLYKTQGGSVLVAFYGFFLSCLLFVYFILIFFFLFLLFGMFFSSSFSVCNIIENKKSTVIIWLS